MVAGHTDADMPWATSVTLPFGGGGSREAIILSTSADRREMRMPRSTPCFTTEELRGTACHVSRNEGGMQSTRNLWENGCDHAGVHLRCSCLV